jgi:glutaconate CoA-transferase subunit A
MPTPLVTDLATAIATIEDGAVVGIGGSTMSRKPMALLRELIRQRRRVDAVTYAGGYDIDLLLATGSLSSVRAGYIGFEYLGRAPHIGSASGADIPIETAGSVIQGLRARAAGLPWLPFTGTTGTDVARRGVGGAVVAAGAEGEEVAAWPAIPLDVALIHAPIATRAGDALVAGASGIDRLLCDAAERVIVSCERLVDRLDASPDGVIPGRRVGHVVEAPYGAHPTSCVPDYRADVLHHLDYIGAVRSGRGDELVSELLEDDLEAYRARWVDVDSLRLEAAS